MHWDTGGAKDPLPSGKRGGNPVITDDEVDAAVRILEDPMAGPFRKQVAREFCDAWLRQEQQTLEWMRRCYRHRHRPSEPAGIHNGA